MPKLLFDVPDFHNPTGITTSAPRRRALVELAERHGFVIVEDDPYRRIRFDGPAVPPIKQFDRSGCVIGLGTVSKILAPGLRVGWVNAAPDIVRRMAAHKADGGSSPFAQRIVAELLASGAMAAHVDEVIHTLRHHRDAMIDAFARDLPDARIRRPSGGYFLWVELPDGIDSDALCRRGEAHGVSVYSGRLCFAEQPPGNFLRLAYSACGPDAIADGVRRLGIAYREITAR